MLVQLAAMLMQKRPQQASDKQQFCKAIASKRSMVR